LRFRLVFAGESPEHSIIVSCDPVRPWIGAAVRRWDGPRWSPAPWVPSAAHALVGRRLDAVLKDPADRTLRFDFGEGWGLVIDLAPQRSNLIVLGAQGEVVASLRVRKDPAHRIAAGTLWHPKGFPPGRLDPFAASAGDIDAALAEPGAVLTEAVTRRLLGVGPTGAELIAEEYRLTGRSPGAVLRERLDALLKGESEVLIEGAGEASTTANLRLLPWRPVVTTPGQRLFARGGPAATASAYYEARDAAARTDARIAALGAILRRELTRTAAAERKVREGLRSFEDPDRHRRLGEALLAGLSVARRDGDTVVVPDPYDEGGREIVVPAPRGRPLSQVADELFHRHRRHRRGLLAAAARAEALAARGATLARLQGAHERIRDEAGLAALEAEMREAGIPVGLLGATRATRASARTLAPQLSGVRMITSPDGWTILVGRTGPDNDRLTFKIAAPEDFWLHAAGVPGAHVVIRNPDRLGTPPSATMALAAGLAVWFSDARSQGTAEVQWTRRKNVKRARGGRSGLVVLKRFEAIRARAQEPQAEV
jgi:predicted ribosome quality control (RQC) complex YloA/Tae2 family protein